MQYDKRQNNMPNGKTTMEVKSKHWSWAVCGKSKIVIRSQLS